VVFVAGDDAHSGFVDDVLSVVVVAGFAGAGGPAHFEDWEGEVVVRVVEEWRIFE
jgi:hypothetical protein